MPEKNKENHLDEDGCEIYLIKEIRINKASTSSDKDALEKFHRYGTDEKDAIDTEHRKEVIPERLDVSADEFRQFIQEICTDSDSFQLRHEKCGGYVDYNIEKEQIECRNCHKTYNLKW